MLQVKIDTERFGYHVFGPINKFVPVNIPEFPVWLNEKERQEATFLTISYALLEEQRRAVSWDHEHHKAGKGMAWQGASLAVTENGLAHVMSNAHLCNDNTVRNCAETNSMTVSFSDLRGGGKVTKIIFTGGLTIPWGDNPIWVLPEEVGKRPTPCGSCRDVIHNFGLPDGRTEVVMLPHGIEGLILPYIPGRRLTPNQALSKSIKQLLPHLTVSLPDPHGTLKESIQRGWDFIQKPNGQRRIDAYEEMRNLYDLEKRTPHLIPARINQIMMELPRDLYQATGHATQFAHIVINRTAQGQYYIGMNFIEPTTPSMHPAVDNAIANMRAAMEWRPRITDVFSSHIDYEAFQNGQALIGRRNQRVIRPLLDGNGSERTKKSTVGNGITNLRGEPLQHGDAHIHEMIPNGILDFNPDIHVFTKPLTWYLPTGYENPKSVHPAHKDVLATGCHLRC